MMVRLAIAAYVCVVSLTLFVLVVVSSGLLVLVVGLSGAGATAYPFVLLFVAFAAGMSAGVTARLLSGFVDRVTEQQLGVEPSVIACAIGLAASFVWSYHSDGVLVSFAVLPPVAAFLGSFVPWRPQSPSVAGVTVAPLALFALLLTLMAQA